MRPGSKFAARPWMLLPPPSSEGGPLRSALVSWDLMDSIHAETTTLQLPYLGVKVSLKRRRRARALSMCGTDAGGTKALKVAMVTG
jgi:hypothetical protein